MRPEDQKSPQTSRSHLQTIKETLFSTAKPLIPKDPRKTLSEGNAALPAHPGFRAQQFRSFPSPFHKTRPRNPFFFFSCRSWCRSRCSGSVCSPHSTSLAPTFFLNKGLKQGEYASEARPGRCSPFSCANICKHMEDSCPAGSGPFIKPGIYCKQDGNHFPAPSAYRALG